MINMKNQSSPAMMQGLSQNPRDNSPNWFTNSAGGILALYGTTCVLGAFGKSRLMDIIPDPLFGISFRQLMLSAGIVGLTMACLCLFTNKRTLTLALIAWLVTNFLVYRIGLWTMGWHHPYAWLSGMMDGFGISPLMADGIVIVIVAYLIIGSIIMLRAGKNGSVAPQLIEAEHGKQGSGHPVFARFLKISCISCGGHVEFPTNILGEKIPCPHCRTTIILQKTRNLKMACAACDGHIEFPDHAIGEKIPCPHCNMDITLKEPA
jgi:DNA-directed RNA polymerase subunit RPC12/RpoP